MMEVVYVDAHNIQQLKGKQAPSVMALGYFDGVHLGHQQVIENAKQQAAEQQLSTAILSFFPHPKSVIQTGGAVHYLEPLEDRIEKLAQLGVDYYYVVKFDEAFSKIEAHDFIEGYVLALGAQHIVCGFDYHYGRKASGNHETLRAYTKQGIGVTIVEEAQKNGEKISSTIIRQCVESGNVAAVPKFLGNYYYTKYCTKRGVADYYMLPPVGRYKAQVEMACKAVVEAHIAVGENRELYFERGIQQKQPVKIVWLEKIHE